MKFCEVPKVGLFCDTYTPSTERRDGTEVRVVTLRLRIQPLTISIAAGIDPYIRRMLFKQDGDVQPHLRELLFALDRPRQQLRCYASPDTPEPTIAFNQVKLGQLRATLRTEADGWLLRFKASVGPCSRAELEYIHEWFPTQRFVSFAPAEGLLFGPDQPADLSAVEGGVVLPPTEDAAPPKRPRRSSRTPTTH